MYVLCSTNWAAHAHLQNVVSRFDVRDVDPLAVDVVAVQIPAAHSDALIAKVGARVALGNIWEAKRYIDEFVNPWWSKPRSWPGVPKLFPMRATELFPSLMGAESVCNRKSVTIAGVPKCKYFLFSRKPHKQILITLSGIFTENGKYSAFWIHCSLT